MHATVSFDEAGNQQWDVVVVGAGPAGSLAAHQIAGLGHRTLLVDKAEFPRTKVCGCCINQGSQAALRAAGLQDLLADLGAVPIREFCVGAPRASSAKLPIKGTVCLSRSSLDAGLVAAAISAGAEFLPGAEARLTASRPDGPGLQLRASGGQTEIRSRVLVAADGVGSSLMHRAAGISNTVQPDSRMGAGAIVETASTNYQAGTIYMACGRYGYAGLVRLEDQRLDIAAALDPHQVKRAGGIGTLVCQIIQEAGFPELPETRQVTWKGTPLLTRSASPCFAERTFLVGDAAAYVEPFTGEGIAWALSGGMAVAPLAGQAVSNWHPNLGTEWAARHRVLVQNRQWSCRLLASGLRHPRLTRGVVSLLARFPILARPLVRSLTTAPK